MEPIANVISQQPFALAWQGLPFGTINFFFIMFQFDQPQMAELAIKKTGRLEGQAVSGKVYALW